MKDFFMECKAREVERTCKRALQMHQPMAPHRQQDGASLQYLPHMPRTTGVLLILDLTELIITFPLDRKLLQVCIPELEEDQLDLPHMYLVMAWVDRLRMQIGVTLIFIVLLLPHISVQYMEEGETVVCPMNPTEGVVGVEVIMEAHLGALQDQGRRESHTIEILQLLIVI
jgi:hypothetical protein